MAKARALEDGVERALSGVAEGRVAEIMAEGDRLGEILVEHERAADRAGKARDLKRVRQARAVMISLRLEKDLRFVLHRLRINSFLVFPKIIPYQSSRTMH